MEYKQQAFAETVLSEQIELFLSCADLPKKDVFSKSDPFVVVYLKENQGRFNEIGRTEVIYDNHFPKFSKSFKIEYKFEEEQFVRFDVYDEDKKNSRNLKHHDIIGTATTNIGELVHESGQMKSLKLLRKGKSVKAKKMYSRITIQCEQMQQTNDEDLTIQFSANGLPKMDGLFGKADPFYEIYKVVGQQWKLVHKSEVVKKTLDPIWVPFKIQSSKLCNKDSSKGILIKVWDWDKNSSPDFIGQTQTTLSQLRKKPTFQLKRPKKNKIYGKLNVKGFQSKELPSFLDYVQGGTDFSLMVAIDFTGSNNKSGLHNIYNGKPSEYQQAIRTIGNIVASYDSDQMYPVWGFGGFFRNGPFARWEGQRQVANHDYPLNFNANNPEVEGIIGIEQVYLNSLKSGAFVFSGPTYFSPVIKKAVSIARVAHNNTKKSNNSHIDYFILLILTDGIINDMKSTKDIIVEAANENLPLSIIIVGVGPANFDKMEELDGDDGRLFNSRGQYAKRDIVQFVPFRDFKNKLSLLAKETLIEVPQQFLSYVNANNLKVPPRTKAKIDVNQFKYDSLKKQQTFIGLPDIKPNYVDASYDNAPLPKGWEKAFDENGDVYYVNHDKHMTQWEHPSKTLSKIPQKQATMQQPMQQQPMQQFGQQQKPQQMMYQQQPKQTQQPLQTYQQQVYGNNQNMYYQQQPQQNMMFQTQQTFGTGQPNAPQYSPQPQYNQQASPQPQYNQQQPQQIYAQPQQIFQQQPNQQMFQQQPQQPNQGQQGPPGYNNFMNSTM